MHKRAQKRTRRSKFWEAVYLPGKGLELIHPEFRKIMDDMRKTDKLIRDMVDPVKPLVRSMRSHLRRRDYLGAAVYIADFHARMRHAMHFLDKFINSMVSGEKEFLLRRFKHPSKEKLFQYNPKATLEDVKRAEELYGQLLKEAGIFDKIKDVGTYTSDLFTNMFGPESSARRLMEKRFSSSFLKEMKEATSDLVNAAEEFMNKLLTSLDKMESGVSNRNVDLYKEHAKELISEFKNFHKLYVSYDKKFLQPLKEKQALMDAETRAVEEAEQNRKQQEENAKLEQLRQKELAEIEEARRSPFVTPYVESPEKPTLQSKPISEFKGPDYEEPTIDEWKAKEEWKTKQEPSTEEEKMIEEIGNRAERSKKSSLFIDNINKFASQDNVFDLLNEIISYSENIENEDPEISDKLLSVANDIINTYKTAGIFDFLKDKTKNQPVEPEKKTEKLEQKTQPKKERPQELTEEYKNLYTPKKLDLPNGRVDKAYTDVSVLKNITPNKMRITLDTSRHLINIFIKRLSAVKNIDNIEPFINSFELNLSPILKQAVYDGWVVSSDSVSDSFNPRDKYLEIYTRLDLSKIDPKLMGTAKLHVACRLSADKEILTIRGIKKHFDIVNLKSVEEMEQEAEAAAEAEEYDEPDYGDYNDYTSQYDE